MHVFITGWLTGNYLTYINRYGGGKWEYLWRGVMNTQHRRPRFGREFRLKQVPGSIFCLFGFRLKTWKIVGIHPLKQTNQWVSNSKVSNSICLRPSVNAIPFKAHYRLFAGAVYPWLHYLRPYIDCWEYTAFLSFALCSRKYPRLLGERVALGVSLYLIPVDLNHLCQYI